jgi:hypothetical protein
LQYMATLLNEDAARSEAMDRRHAREAFASQQPAPHRPRLRPYSAFLAELGKTPCTGWRYAKNGWIKLTNIAGKNYTSQEAEDEFLRRAQAGEFARAATVPRRGCNGGGAA